jgi:hypothetical protein
MPRTRYEFFNKLRSSVPCVCLRDRDDDDDDDDDMMMTMMMTTTLTVSK